MPKYFHALMIRLSFNEIKAGFVRWGGLMLLKMSDFWRIVV
jgi:hypothetical protein